MKLVASTFILAIIALALTSVDALGVNIEPAFAAKTIHVGDTNNNSLNDVQDACLDTGGSVESWTFVINQIRTGDKPDPVTVVFDTDGNGSGDTSVDVSPGPQGGSSNAHYTVTGTGTVVDATATIDDDWRGQFVLSHVECGPPADACAPFDGRFVIEFDVRLGDPNNPFGPVVEESAPEAISIPAGTYAVTLKSSDEHSVHGGQAQFEEQWRARFTAGGTVDSGLIADLPDDQDEINQQVGTVTFTGTATEVVARHKLAGTPSPWTTPESVVAVCVALDRVD